MLLEVRAGDTPSGPGGVVARSSVARGKSMSPGIQQAPFYWRDVVHGPPPRRRERGACLYVTFHGTDDTGDVRLGFSTVIHVDPGADIDSARDDIIHIEERLNIQRRFLQEWIDRERAFSDRLAMRMRSRLARSLASQRRLASGLRVALAITVLLWWIRAQAKLGTALIRGTRALLRGLVVVPDAILTHGENASIRLASRTGRRTIRNAFRDPASATPQEKTAVLVVISFSLLGAVLVLNTVFATVFAGFARAYGHALADFTASLLGTLAVPLPAEPLLVASLVSMGFVLGGIGLYFGKIVGSWMLYLLGDSLFDAIDKKSTKSPRTRRFVNALQRGANRWGFLLLVLINAIPLMPDLLVIVFAVSGMRFRSFMGGIAVGTLLKFIMIGAAVYFIGPDTVKAFLEHPIATLRAG